MSRRRCQSLVFLNYGSHNTRIATSISFMPRTLMYLYKSARGISLYPPLLCLTLFGPIRITSSVQASLPLSEYPRPNTGPGPTNSLLPTVVPPPGFVCCCRIVCQCCCRRRAAVRLQRRRRAGWRGRGCMEVERSGCWRAQKGRAGRRGDSQGGRPEVRKVQRRATAAASDGAQQPVAAVRSAPP